MGIGRNVHEGGSGCEGEWTGDACHEMNRRQRGREGGMLLLKIDKLIFLTLFLSILPFSIPPQSLSLASYSLSFYLYICFCHTVGVSLLITRYYVFIP